MTSRPVVKSVKMDPETLKELRALARKLTFYSGNDVSVSQLIREGISMLLNKHKPQDQP